MPTNSCFICFVWVYSYLHQKGKPDTSYSVMASTRNLKMIYCPGEKKSGAIAFIYANPKYSYESHLSCFQNSHLILKGFGILDTISRLKKVWGIPVAFSPAHMKGIKPGMRARGESDLITHLQQTRKALSIKYMALFSFFHSFLSFFVFLSFSPSFRPHPLTSFRVLMSRGSPSALDRKSVV